MGLMCPVRVSLREPVARSQILMVRSAEPEANQALLGSTDKQRTHPVCPLITLISRHSPCTGGFIHSTPSSSSAILFLLLPLSIKILIFSFKRGSSITRAYIDSAVCLFRNLLLNASSRDHFRPTQIVFGDSGYHGVY